MGLKGTLCKVWIFYREVNGTTGSQKIVIVKGQSVKGQSFL